MLSRSAILLIATLPNFLIADTSLAGRLIITLITLQFPCQLNRLVIEGPTIKERSQRLIQRLRGTMTPIMDLGRAAA
jgi:hypothetical protein